MMWLILHGFSQGVGGDASTRWTRRGATFSEAERLGHLLAGEALRVLEGIETRPDIKVVFLADEVLLPTRGFPSPEEADRLLKEATKQLESLKASNASYGDVRSAYVAELGAKVCVKMAHPKIPPQLTAEIGLVTLGDIRIALPPGEVFSLTGLTLQKALGENSMVFGYTEGSFGYILPAEEEVKGGYETGASILKPEAEQLLRDAVMNLALHNIKGKLT
jgi:neutral ceramidase